MPIKILPLGFLAIILLGTVLLMLPAASHGKPLDFFSALFTATSSSCVTGLVLVDTGTHFTFFGQSVLLFLIQLGGLGFMTASTFLFLALRRRVSLRSRMMMAESLGENKLQGVFSLALKALKYTFTIEAIGAILLATRFIPEYGLTRGIWYSIFHSISAFCNAGFDLIGGFRSLMPFVNDVVINFTVMFLIVTGGLGFAVIADINSNKSFKKLNLHSKVAISSYAICLIMGFIAFFSFENTNADTLGNMSFPAKIQSALFQSVTCRTAGFNTIDQAALTDPSKLIATILMFIGGAPAGTAGGIKVTTIAVLFLSVRALVHNNDDVEAYGRRLSVTNVRRALCLFLLSVTLLLSAVMAISVIEHGNGLAFIDILYEVASAMGTVGLSVGVTSALSPPSLMIICFLMYTGRVGLLTFTLAIGSRGDSTVIRYPESNIMVG